MGVTIKKRLDFFNFLGEARENFKEIIQDEFTEELLEQIEKGITPVKGQGMRFTKYSKGYTEAIRAGKIPGKTKVSPVTLKQTGDMYKSLVVDIKGENPRITFDDPAFYHNNTGVGFERVKRRILPDGEGEEFSLNLFRKIMEKLKRAVALSIK